MELILIKSYKHLSLFEREWKGILEENKNTNPFIEYEFIYNWWKSFIGNIKIEIHAVKENNRIIAFLPFQMVKTWFGYKIQFLSINSINYIDIIAKIKDMDRVIMFTFDALIKQKKSAVFYLNGFVEDWNTPVKLSNYLKARNMKVQSKRIENTNTDFQDISTLKTIFSTNTLCAKAYRNFLWVKENSYLKGIK